MGTFSGQNGVPKHSTGNISESICRRIVIFMERTAKNPPPWRSKWFFALLLGSISDLW